MIGCPKCRERFAVPRFAEDDEPVDEQPAEYWRQERAGRAPRPKPPPLEEEDDDDRPRYRRRAAAAAGAASASGLPDFLTEWNLDKMLLVGSIGVGLVLFGGAGGAAAAVRPVRGRLCHADGFARLGHRGRLR